MEKENNVREPRSGILTRCAAVIRNPVHKRKFTAFIACCISILNIYYFNSVSVHQFHQYINRNNLAQSTLSRGDTDEVTCKFPRLNPFDKTILKFVKVPKLLDCTAVHEREDHAKVKYDLLFKTDYASNLIMLKDFKHTRFESCCHKNFTRTEDDVRTRYSPYCTKITSNVTAIKSEHEFIAIFCLPKSVETKNSTSRNVTVRPRKQKPVDLFNFIPLKPSVEERIKKFLRTNSSSNSQVNVLVIGIDSVSHMNFLRMMPKTREYLMKELFAISMNGYTKVGDNTYPNIVPVLTGLTYQELERLCCRKRGYYDKCPFIWKNFSAHGYRTSYAEDGATIGLFNYAKRGFSKQPTDYYLRTLTQPMEATIGHINYPTYLCYGPRRGFSIVLENIKKLAVAMGKDRRYFQFTWATSLFHSEMNRASMADVELRDMLKWLKDEGHLETTALVVMSDHGVRYGGIRNTFQGKIEDRMPFLYFSFPKWFHRNYSAAASNLKLNQHRLTTPFDFHETLKDFLYMENITETRLSIRVKELAIQMKQPRGISMFLPIPANRTCEAARIQRHYCVCNPMLPVSVADKEVRTAAAEAVKELNKIVGAFPQCSVLTLKKILSAEIMNMEVKSNNTAKTLSSAAGSVSYRVTFVTVPGNATFEATICIDRVKKPSWTSSGAISRTDLYKNQSTCVEDSNLKKFCFCR